MTASPHIIRNLFSSNPSKQNAGYSLVEIAVVISVLSILSAISIPNILKWVQLARIVEAKSILNSAAADCLTESRSGAAAALAATPRSLDAERLSTTGYQIKDGKDKCQEISIAPASADDKLSYEIGFRLVDGRIEKFAFPADNQDSLNSCKAWAGKNCGASEAQLAEWARLAALQVEKQKCNDAFNDWLRDTPPNGGTGQRNRWDDSTNTCTNGTWAFQGTIQRDEAAFNQARDRALGVKCRAEYEPNVGKLDGLFTYTDPDCGSPTYFCSGNDLATTDLAVYEACKVKEASDKCLANREQARQNGHKGAYGPHEGPEECGKKVWICDSKIVDELEYWKTCGYMPPQKCKGTFEVKGDPDCKEWESQMLKARPQCGLRPVYPYNPSEIYKEPNNCRYFGAGRPLDTTGWNKTKACGDWAACMDLK